MHSFLVKKTFYEMWDNFLPLLFMNLGFIGLAGGFFIAPSFFGFFELIRPYIFAYLAGGALLVNFYMGGVYRAGLEMSDGRRVGFLAFLRFLASSWKQSLVSAVLTVLLLAAALYAVPYYLFAESVFFLILGALLFWTWFTVLLAGLFFPPASVRLKKPLFKSLRDSFTFVFDNTLFCLFALLVFLAIMAVSLISFLIIPGMATAVLWLNNCFKLRLYKYAYLEAHPGANRKNIPWDSLIEQDVAKLGKRSLRGLIFPWKD